MVEAGILAAVAVVMSLIGVYVPVLGTLLNFVWPLPIVVCGCRHGLKYSIMSLLVASVIIAAVISPVQAFFLCAIFGVMGIILGECMRRHLPPLRLMFFGSIGAGLAFVINILLCFLVLGIDPVETIFASFNESLGYVEEFYRSHNFSSEQLAASLNDYRNMLKLMRIIMPAAFLLSAPCFAFLNYQAAKAIMVKLGDSFPPFPPFRELTVPAWVLYPFVLSLFAVTYFYQTGQQQGWPYLIAVNVQTLTSFLLLFQAIVLLYWYCQTKGKPAWWANVGTALVLFVPLLGQLMIYVGAFDMVADFRKLRHRKR